jgi:hypothetical protein
MAESIVDALEAVEVRERDAEGPLVPRGILEFTCQHMIEIGAI